MTHKMKPSGKGRPKIVILNLDQFDLWPCFSTDKTHRVSQTLQKAYHLTRLDKRPHAEALQGPESRVSSLLEYCRTQKLSQKITKGLLRAGIDSLTSLGLLRTEDVANMTFVDKTEDALRLKMAIVKLRTEQPLDPVYSLGHQLAVEKSKVSSSSRMDFLDLAKSPKVRSVQAKLPARKPTMLVRSTFGSNSPKPKKTRLSPNKTKKQYRSLLAYKTCTNCENTFTALYKNWHLCQGCHEQQRMRWVHIPPQGSHHPNRDWLGRSTSPPHDVLSSGSLSSSDSSGYLSSSSRGHRESSVFYCPNYGCHFFGKKLDDLEGHIMRTHPPIPTEPETEITNQSTSECGTMTEVELTIDGNKLAMVPTERGNFWLKPSLIYFDGLLFYTIIYRNFNHKVGAARVDVWLYAMTCKAEADWYQVEVTPLKPRTFSTAKGRASLGKAQSVERGLKQIHEARYRREIVSFSMKDMIDCRDHKTGNIAMRVRIKISKSEI